MSILQRTQFGDPILRKKAKRVVLKTIHTPAFKTLVRDMFATIQDIGVGLAAPQVGKSIQLAVIDVHPLPHRPHVEPYKRAIINPRIIQYSRSTVLGYEGCLSCDGVRGRVPRAKEVAVEYRDDCGVKHREVARGLLARVFQHEIDHLHGILYVDHMADMRTLMTVQEYEKRILKQ